jgi:hypothetical protein
MPVSIEESIGLFRAMTKFYYFGTWADFAYAIMTEGFKLGEIFHWRTKTEVVYG